MARLPRQERPIAKGGMTVNVDITDGPSVEITKDGPRASRIARVSGLLGDGASRLWWATNAPGIPKYGDHHPVILGLPLSRIHAVLASEGTTDIATVTLDYFYPTGGNMHFANVDGVRDAVLPQLEIVSTVQPAQTQRAYWAAPPRTEESDQPEPVWLRWREDPSLRIPAEEGPPGPWQYQGGQIDFQEPMMVFRYARREPSETYIGDKARAFIRHINSQAIFGDPNVPGTGDPPRTWLCTRIDGVSDDAGLTYNTTYEFQYRSETWDPVLVFTDPETGKPVPFPVWGESIRQVRVFPLANFFELGLSIPD